VEFLFVKNLEREATPERIFVPCHLRQSFELVFRMVSVRPSSKPSMIEHAEKWSIRNIRKQKQCSSTSTSTSTFARVYLRLRFAAQAVLKARRNGVGKSIVSGKGEGVP
jgi:hypothetical protein